MSNGGEISAYFLRLIAPRDELKHLAEQSGSRVVLASDGEYYVGDDTLGPEPNIFTVLGERGQIEEMSNETSGSFEDGFLKGVVFAGAKFLRGSLKVNLPTEDATQAVVALQPFCLGRVGVTPILDQHYMLPRNIGECSVALQSLKSFVEASNRSEWKIIESVARTDWPPFCTVSQQLTKGGQCALEIIREIREKSDAAENPVVLGQLQGRTCLEVLAIITAESCDGSMPKLQVLKKLEESILFSQPKKHPLIQAVIDLWRSSPFACL